MSSPIDSRTNAPKFDPQGMILVYDPATGAVLDRVAAAAPEDVRAAIARARDAASHWRALGFGGRGAALKEVRAEFLRRGEEIAGVVSRESGKPLAEALLADVLPNGDLFSYWIKSTERLLRPEKVGINPITMSPGKKAWIRWEPRGVVGLITPWNYPVAIPIRSLVPALMAGNTVVLKPSEYAALSGRIIEEVFASLPEGVVEVVQGGGDVGAAVVEGGVDLVIFTGSVATGRKIARAAAERLTPVALELGGKDAAIVLDDADLDRAAEGLVWGAFTNCGQNCASTERVFVHERVAEAFVQRVRAATARLVAKGNAQGDVGPLTNANQFAIVAAQVAEARERGATVVAGGEPMKAGYGFQPTILEGVTDEMSVMRDETFGPVMPIVRISSDDEAVARANGSRYGLTASVWTRDIARGERLAGRLACGVVTVNNVGFTGAVPTLPWSGVKETGYGATNSHVALKEMVHPKVVLLDRNKAKELWWYPYNDAVLAIARAMIRLAAPGAGKLRAVIQLLRNFPRRWK